MLAAARESLHCSLVSKGFHWPPQRDPGGMKQSQYQPLPSAGQRVRGFAVFTTKWASSRAHPETPGPQDTCASLV